jgi:HK97 family phage prohead protease
MSNKIFHWTNTFKSLGEQADGSVEIKGLASTNSQDRAGDVIEVEAWTKGGVDNYLQNPIVLYNHNHDKPIGRAKAVRTVDNGLEFTAKISKAAGEITELIKDGVLGAFSVGFRVKDADHIPDTGGLRIKDAELFEVSVVSVPCNQGAMFSLSKGFDNMEEYEEFKKSFIKTNSADSVKTEEVGQSKVAQADIKENRMSEEMKAPEGFDLDAFAKEVAEKAATKLAMQQAESKAAEEKAAKEAAEKAALVEAEQKAQIEAEQEKQKEVVVSVMTGAEKLMGDVEERFNKKGEELESLVKELQTELKEKSEEIQHIRESKRVFSDRGQSGDWRKSFEQDILDAKFAGLATGKGWENTYSKSILEKVNQHSGVEVSSADFEQVVSANVERDIQNELVLAPLFREIAMNSASQILPILPDAGYAEFVSPAGTGAGTSPYGNLETRGDTVGAPFTGVTMTERSLSTNKLISKSFLGNETEEDAIIPILPLLRESMVRSHARGIENAILLGNHADGAYTSGIFDGLLQQAQADSDFTDDVGSGSPAAFSATDKVLASDLLEMRKNMGKYGVNPNEVVYLVSQDAYYNLLEDAEFQDANLVGDMATKLSGEIGQVFGSRVILCDEFPSKAAEKFAAVAVYPRNYVIPRLRGVTIESDYDVENQRRVLVASQRIGFADIIEGATSKWGFKYDAA